MQLSIIKRRLKNIEKQLKKYNDQITKFPQGEIVCYHNGIYSRWYYKSDRGREWIRKKDKEFASTLAYKKYLQAMITDLNNEKMWLESIMEKMDSKNGSTSHTEEILNNPLYAELLSGAFSPRSKKLEEWTKENYPHNTMHPEQLIHPTLAGFKVRSKSEGAIERALTTFNIPFRYEPEFQLNNSFVYPDFVILHPKTEEIYIWEHFGVMDNYDYARHTFRKLEQYYSCGYVIGERLIATFEKKNMPFNYNEAEEIVWKYFLN